jgi:conjugal transfer pilus assembly protein TrbC
MMRALLFLILCSLFLTAKADDFNDYLKIALAAKNHEKEAISPYQADAVIARNKMTLIKDEVNLPIDVNTKKPLAILFISFSMPKKSIVAIIKDAKKIGASVVIRGLIHNSFKETFLLMAAIVKEAGGGGVELNPPLFKKYNIKEVPSLVLLPDAQTCSQDKVCPENNFDVVYGDIPLLDGLKVIRDHGSVSKNKAEELLSILGDTLHG